VVGPTPLGPPLKPRDLVGSERIWRFLSPVFPQRLSASAGHSSLFSGHATMPRDEAQERQGLPLRRRGAEKGMQKKKTGFVALRRPRRNSWVAGFGETSVDPTPSWGGLERSGGIEMGPTATPAPGIARSRPA
jgi:hypothetical protein